MVEGLLWFVSKARRRRVTRLEIIIMRKRINKAIAHLNLEIAGGGRDGVFYFVDTITNQACDAESVYVSAMTHLTIEQWVEEATYARNLQTLNN